MALEDTRKRKTKRTPVPLYIGYCVSAIWGLFFVTYVIRNYPDIRDLAPNSLGDFFAGVFAPLAFLWLLVATLLQREELGLQRQELELNREVLLLQARELEKSVEQLKAQAQILEKQLESQRKQKALTDVQEGIHGVCSIVISKFSGKGGSMTQGSQFVAESWIGPGSLASLLENENYTFLIQEIVKALERTKEISGHLSKQIRVAVRKMPSILEIDRILIHIRRVIDIPTQEGFPELKQKFELEFPLPALLESMGAVRNLAFDHKLSK